MSRAKSITDGSWVKGDFVSLSPFAYIITNEQKRRLKTPISPDDESETPITVNATRVMEHTRGEYTDFVDTNDTEIYEGDIVRFFGMIGVITQECGAFGIGFSQTIDYEVLEKAVPIVCGNPHFLYNDNFISLWEISWNFNEFDSNICDDIEVIGNKYDNPELLSTR